MAFSARGRGDRLALVDDEAEDAGERLLERVAAHLAVALCAVRVADVEAGAGVEHGQVQARADGQRWKSMLPP